MDALTLTNRDDGSRFTIDPRSRWVWISRCIFCFPERITLLNIQTGELIDIQERHHDFLELNRLAGRPVAFPKYDISLCCTCIRV